MRYKIVSLLALSALMLGVLPGCQTTPTQQGTATGAALGAGIGAIVGHQQDKQGEGALIGAGIGAIAGALIGDQVDERRSRTQWRAQQTGHYETRLVRSASGETYEERVWVPGN